MKKTVTIIISAIITCTILLVTVFLLTRRHVIYITNYNEFVGTMSESHWIYIEDAIKDYIEDAGEVTNDNFGMTVRLGSFTSNYVSDNVMAVNFLIDIEALFLSYDIYYSYSTTDSSYKNITINCVPSTDVIYPDQQCVGMNNSYKSLELYIPYSFTLDDGTKVSLKSDYRNGAQRIVIEVYSCNGMDKYPEAESATRRWLHELGLEPNDYVYNLATIYNNCFTR